MSSRGDVIESLLAEALGRGPAPVTLTPTAGGCINTAALAVRGGETFFVKWNDHPAPGQFAAEAAGLEAMSASATSLQVPAPVAFCDDGPGRALLIVEYMPPGARAADFDERLGRGLAEMHGATSERGFGFVMDGYCGATPQPNGWMSSWVEFFGERRLAHQLRLARRAGLDKGAARAVDAVIAKLPELIGDDEAPALIHGDLWSGNLHTAPDGRPALIDPAAYYGHREAELGMMGLFGGFSSRVYDAYDEAWPLAPGWRERTDLYALYHVLNHFNLFGGGYGAQAGRMAKRYA
jgi:fructosamine-3-kinase